MRRRRLGIGGALVVLVALAASVSASAGGKGGVTPGTTINVVVTFDVFAGQPNQWVGQIGTQAFTFTARDFSNSELIVTTPSTCDFGGCISDGSPYIGEQGSSPGQPIVVAQAKGRRFKLLGFSAGPLYADAAAAAAAGVPNATEILVVGTKPTGAQVSATFALDAGSIQAFTLPTTFKALKSVTLYGNDGSNSGAISIDNVHLTFRT